MGKKKPKGRRCWLCYRKLPKAGYRRHRFYTGAGSFDTKPRDVHGSCLKKAPKYD